MHIGFLTPEYPHERTGRSGGIGTSIFNLARMLVELGHSVTVFVCYQAHDAIFYDEGVKVIQIKNRIARGFSWILTRKKIQRIINNHVHENNLSIVESPDWLGLSAFVSFDCPSIIRCNGSDTYFCFLEERKQKAFNKFLELRAMKRADGLLSVSDFTAEISSQLFKINKRKFTIIHNGINEKLFPVELSKNKNSNTILYFGTLIRKKGLLELAHIFNLIFKKNKASQLVLIGGDAIDPIEKKSTWSIMQSIFDNDSIKNVNYLNKMPYNLLAKEIGKATVCVFPSFVEAFPVSWLEAMSCGKAIVASNIGWAGECIESGREGYLVDPKNHEEYASKVNQLLDDPIKNYEFGSNARKKVESKFTSTVIAQKSIDFYQKFI